MPIIYKNGNIYGGASSADDVSFDDTTSSLSATNVQDAIDEVVERVWEGTLAQYNAITVKDPNTVYYVTDANPVNIGLNDLSDVTVSNNNNNINLYYNVTAGEWRNRASLSTVNSNTGDTTVRIGANNSSTINLVDTDGIAKANFYLSSLGSGIDLSNLSGATLLSLQAGGSYNCGEIRLSKYVNNTATDTAVISGKEGSIYCVGGITSYSKITATAFNTGSGDVTLSSKTASYGGTDLSLVTTGEKYNWDNKAQGYLIRNMQIKSGSPGVISNTGGYATMMVLGFAQSIGAIAVLVKINNNSITSTIDMFTGSAFSSAALTFSYSSSAQQFTISSTNANNSTLTVIKAGL